MWKGHFSGPGALAYKPGMWRADRGESPLGGMGGMGIHMVDLIIHLAGRFQVGAQPRPRLARPSTTPRDARPLKRRDGRLSRRCPSRRRYWRVALFGTDGLLELQGHERLSFTPREGEGWVRESPKTDIEAAELAAFAAAVAGGRPIRCRSRRRSTASRCSRR
jgi:predicted dehydrogenase